MSGKKWTKEEILVLSREYGRVSRGELLNMLPGRSYSSVSGKSFQLGLKGTKTNSNRIYNVDQEAFSVVSNESSYWAGFIAADGHVTPGGQLKVKLANKDSLHLDKLKKFLQYTGPLFEHEPGSYPNGQNTKELCVQSVVICRDLMKNFGIPSGKKSDVLDLPNISNDYLLSYIYGYFDGDGCLYVSKKGYVTINFVGNRNFLLQMRNILDSQFDMVTSEPYKNTVSDAELYRISGRNAIRVLDCFSEMYDGLTRKQLQ